MSAKILRVNPASNQVVMFGPAIDPSDGVTLAGTQVAAMDATTTGIRISKNGAAWADRAATVVASVYDEGWHQVTLKPADLNTVGRLDIMYTDSVNVLPIFDSYQIMAEGPFEALYGTEPSIIAGTCDAAGSTNTAATSLEATHSVTDALVGRILIYDGNVTSNLEGQGGSITAYNGTSGLITFAAATFSHASASGDTFKIY